MGTISAHRGSERSTARPAAQAGALGRVGRREPTDAGPQLERYRRELYHHCWRMLRSTADAEDAVQETLVRAWRSLDRFEARSSLRAWLYRIATNVCFDSLRRQQRRARPMDLDEWRVEAEGRPALALAGGTAEATGDRAGTVSGDPAELVASREAVREAFLVALRTLPPRQRAVLILRDVLRWRTDEVAELLGSTEISVRSALQRARATLAAGAGANADVAGSEPGDGPQRRLLGRYVDAFERSDIQSLVSLLHLDHLGRTA